MVLCDRETGPRAFLVQREGTPLDSCLLDGTRVAGMDPAEVQPKHTHLRVEVGLCFAPNDYDITPDTDHESSVRCALSPLVWGEM